MNRIKKVLFSGIICLLLILPLSMTVSAELTNKSLPRVVDDAGLLTDNEEKILESQIKTITDKYDFDVVIVTANTLNGKTPMEYADDYYDYEGYGAGKNHDGMLLLVSMEDRDWWISTTGYGIEAITDAKIQSLGERLTPYLRDEKYKNGFESFLEYSENYISTAKSSDQRHVFIAIAGSFLVGLIAALITVFTFKSQLKSVRFQGGAVHYEVAGSMNLTRSNDVFLYRNVSRSRRAESSSGGGGGSGSSTHTSSSGTTHGGGGGKF